MRVPAAKIRAGWRLLGARFGDYLEMGTRREKDSPVSGVGARWMKDEWAEPGDPTGGAGGGNELPWGHCPQAHTQGHESRDLSWKCGFGAHRGAGRDHGRSPDNSEGVWHILRRTQRDPWAETGDTLSLPDAKGAASKTRGKPGERGGRDAKQEGFKGERTTV